MRIVSLLISTESGRQGEEEDGREGRGGERIKY